MSDRDTISISDTKFLTVAQYEWKYVAGSIVRYFKDDAENKSKEAHFKLIDSKIENLRRSVVDKFETFLFSDGSGNSSKDPEGLGNIVDATPTTARTVGNIAQTTYSWWQNKQKTATGAASVYLLGDMRTLFNNASNGQDSDVPNLIVTDLPNVADPTIQIIIDNETGSTEVGTVVVGQTRDLGLTVYGARTGIQDYSRKVTDEFGNFTIVERAFAKRGNFDVVVANAKIDALADLLASYRATPVVWIGTDDYSSTWIYGFYKDFGLGRSRGTIPLQIAGNVRFGGLYETAFGLSLGDIVNIIGGGSATGRPVKAVQVGGPLGAYFPRSLFDTPFGYEEFAGKDGLIGHAGLTIFDDSADMLEMARFAMEFCAIESCGKCTPCRIGAVRGVETINRIKRGDAAAMPILTDLCNTMKSGSLCALGGFTPYPVMSAVTHFPDDFQTQKEAAE
jgi:hypothetical protein